jgi:uncharacterized membrane protein YdjX (TVP38/TMEM64 family)
MFAHRTRQPSRFETNQHGKRASSTSLLWSAVVMGVCVVLVAAFLYFDRNNQISRLIQSTGGWGILLSVVLMALFCVIPVPSEFLILLDMRVYGAWWGALYSWGGSILGSIAVFLLARYAAPNLLKHLISEAQMDKVATWVRRRGIVGLLLVRIIPLPFIVVNYTAGIVRSIPLWTFIWTTAVGGIPYYTGAGLVFLGVSKKYMVWLAVGGTAIAAIWVTGYFYNRHTNKHVWRSR